MSRPSNAIEGEAFRLRVYTPDVNGVERVETTRAWASLAVARGQRTNRLRHAAYAVRFPRGRVHHIPHITIERSVLVWEEVPE